MIMYGIINSRLFLSLSHNDIDFISEYIIYVFGCFISLIVIVYIQWSTYTTSNA